MMVTGRIRVDFVVAMDRTKWVLLIRWHYRIMTIKQKRINRIDNYQLWTVFSAQVAKLMSFYLRLISKQS
jgi:hypothetical protein